MNGSSSGLWPAERQILARAYGEAADLLAEYGWVAVEGGEGAQADHDACLSLLIEFGRQRSAELSETVHAARPMAGPVHAYEAWGRLLQELDGDGELLSPVNVTVHGSIGYWGLELLAAYARLRQAEFRP